MKSIALYARVSSDQQAERGTIDSQVAALRERAVAEGQVVLPEALYIDNGFSGTTLLRPALERLRDRIAEGAVEVVYVHSPDRLARRYAYQVLLLDEFRARGVEVKFLQSPTQQSPEDALLLQVQGMLAEYECAKIVERGRRGRLHKARQGVVNALACAPYGYYGGDWFDGGVFIGAGPWFHRGWGGGYGYGYRGGYYGRAGYYGGGYRGGYGGGYRGSYGGGYHGSVGGGYHGGGYSGGGGFHGSTSGGGGFHGGGGGGGFHGGGGGGHR